MKFEENQGKVILTNFNSFNIEEILECGQCFRFNKIENMHYKVIAHRRELFIKQEEGKVIFSPCTLEEFENIWFNYFDLGTDYSELKKLFKDDNVLVEAISFAEGIRILNQEPFECLISFIISQNNRIPMIKQVVKNISEKYGDKINDEYAFPTIEQLSKATSEELRECKTGFRDKYILDCLEKINSNEIDIENTYDLTTKELKDELMKIKGVGTKVADCALLFSFKRKDVFPVDVWIKRVMEQLYFNGEETKKEVISQFADEKFGKYSGIAQQYLFNYAIYKKIGK